MLFNVFAICILDLSSPGFSRQSEHGGEIHPGQQGDPGGADTEAGFLLWQEF